MPPILEQRSEEEVQGGLSALSMSRGRPQCAFENLTLLCQLVVMSLSMVKLPPWADFGLKINM